MKQSWSSPFRYLTGIILLVAFVWLLYYARIALQPLIVAAFIAYLINPAVLLLTSRTRLAHRAAVNVVYFTAIALFVVAPLVLTPIFFKQLQGVGRDLVTALDSIQGTLSQPFELAGLRISLEQLATGLANIRRPFSLPMPEQAFFMIESTTRGVIWFLVIVVCIYLFMAEWRTMRLWLIDLAPAPQRPELHELYHRIRVVWMSYLRGQLLLMFIVGVVFTIAWSIIGIPGALVLGVIAGLFTLVPDVGPFVAVALAMAVALLEGSSWIQLPHFWVMMIVLATYLVLITIKNFWLRPVIMGRSVNMNEGLVLVVILIATILNGILGALLAVPVLATAVIVIDFLLKRIADVSPQPANGRRRPPRKFNRN
jgi:predicted PurR-regulated permease PerM